MPQQVESGMVVMVDGISDAHVGRKVRVAGRCTGVCAGEGKSVFDVARRMLTYDPELALVLLYDAECALLVDVQLCIHAEALLAPPEDRTTDAGRSGGDSDADRLVRWARERKSYVWVLGHLERTQASNALSLSLARTRSTDVRDSRWPSLSCLRSAHDRGSTPDVCCVR